MPRPSRTLKIGSAAPDFELPALNGEAVGLWDCLLEGPLFIEFIRGTWCPNARRRLEELAGARQRFRELWTRILVIVCEDPFTVTRYFHRRPTPLTVLLDTERRATRAYGVHLRFGIERWNIARPASFLIDRAGFVRHILVARWQTECAPLDDLLDEVRRLDAETGQS